MSAVISFCGLCLLLVTGKFLRVKIKLLQKLYLPSSVIGGVLGLIILTVFRNYIPSDWISGWSKLPGFLINIVFAALFLGVHIPGIKKIWNIAGQQLCYGQIVAWANIWWNRPRPHCIRASDGSTGPVRVILPVGFEGGHGTAGGLAQVFSDLGWKDGRDLGLASATIGMVSGIIIGMWLINLAVRRGFVANVRVFEQQSRNEQTGIYDYESQPPAGRQTVSADSIDSLALHLAIVGIAILIGYLFKLGFKELNDYMPASIQKIKILDSFPLFPLCMIGGLLIQLFINRLKIKHIVNHNQMSRISGAALDFLVVAAISTIKINLIIDNWIPFVSLAIAGIIWNVFCVLWLAKRILSKNIWFEQSIAEMGQSMGVTATGLMLLRTVDPEEKTMAPAAFGYKQLLHEPFMGGGLWTSMAIPLVMTQGGFTILGISITAITFWLVFWRLFLSRGRKFFKPD